MRRISMGCLIALMIPCFSAAQSSPESDWPPKSGTRVRLTAPPLGVKSQTGTLLSATHDSLFFEQQPGSSHRSISVAQITWLQVSRGTHTSKMRDSMIGLGAGAAVGAIVGSFALKPKSGDFFYNSDTEAAKFGATLGGVIGGLLGGITGLFMGARQSDTWTTLGVPRS